MNRLEYYLADPNSLSRTLLFHYDNIPMEEIAIRNECDFFIKNGTVYIKTGVSKTDESYCIEVQQDLDHSEGDDSFSSEPAFIKDHAKYQIELREYIDAQPGYYPLRKMIGVNSLAEVLLNLQCGSMRLSGIDWYKTSSEMDEDRKMYVFYATPHEKRKEGTTNE